MTRYFKGHGIAETERNLTIARMQTFGKTYNLIPSEVFFNQDDLSVGYPYPELIFKGVKEHDHITIYYSNDCSGVPLGMTEWDPILNEMYFISYQPIGYGDTEFTYQITTEEAILENVPPPIISTEY